MEVFRKRWIGCVVAFVLLAGFLLSLSGCATPTKTHYDSAAVMGAAGAAAGAILDKNNRWRGAVVGGAIGAATGYGLEEVRR